MGPSSAAGTAGAGARQPGTMPDDALEALRLDWGGLYMIGHDEEHGWWAARHGRIGHVITGDGPDELQAAIAGDHGPARA